jgi:8-oxo-dGTP pyrophosphatase MutT (NUDIX family)
MSPSAESATPAARPVRQAATLIVLRNGSEGLEALLLRRADKANDQNSGASVFPGGLLDAHDRQLHGCCAAGLDDAAASARLSIAQGGLDYYAAAVRECFEEAGLLLAQDSQGKLVDLDGLGDEQLAPLRRAAAAGTDALLAMCRARGWQLATDRLAYFAHWLTPPGMPRRFDTRFFVAALPHGQRVAVDGVEIANHAWLRPAAAIAPERGLKLMNVTRRILQQLAQFSSVDECLAHARALRDIPLTMPRLADGPGGSRAVNMDEPAYAEIAFIDPEGLGHARHTLEAGLVLRLSPRVWRVTAADAGDGKPGAHSYFVACGSGEGCAAAWALIDPLPAHAGQLDTLRAKAPGPVRWILCTRGQPTRDALAALQQVWPDAEVPTVLAEGQRLQLDDATLQVLPVPGDAQARRFLLLPDRLLFTGEAAGGDCPDAAWIAPASGFLRAAAAVATTTATTAATVNRT